MTTKVKQKEILGLGARIARLYSNPPVSGPPPTMWPVPGEATTDAPWQDADMDSKARKAVALMFAGRISKLGRIEEIRIKDLRSDLKLVVVLSAPDRDFARQIRDDFVELVCDTLDLSEGELSIYPANKLPDWVPDLPTLS